MTNDHIYCYLQITHLAKLKPETGAGLNCHVLERVVEGLKLTAAGYHRFLGGDGKWKHFWKHQSHVYCSLIHKKSSDWGQPLKKTETGRCQYS